VQDPDSRLPLLLHLLFTSQFVSLRLPCAHLHTLFKRILMLVFVAWLAF
jgi:hypothetical protein